MKNEKKDFTLEELKSQLREITEKHKALEEQINQKEKDEEDRKKAELALEQEKRKAELDEARKHYNTLLKAYLKDYGAYSSTMHLATDDIFPNEFWRSFF